MEKDEKRAEDEQVEKSTELPREAALPRWALRKEDATIDPTSIPNASRTRALSKPDSELRRPPLPAALFQPPFAPSEASNQSRSTNPNQMPGLIAPRATPSRVLAPKSVSTPEKNAEELSAYLDNDFNLELYVLMSAKKEKSFYPLSFFKELHYQYNFVKENKSNPGLVLSRIKQVEQAYVGQAGNLLSNDPIAKLESEGIAKIQFRHLLAALAMLIRNEYEVDGNIQDKEMRCCLMLIEQHLENRLLESDIREQVMREIRSLVPKRKFDFIKVKNQIKALPNIQAKLQYLSEILSEYRQQDLVDEDISQGFGKKCQIEIDSLKERMTFGQPDADGSEDKAENQADNPAEASWRSRILALLLLTFGRLDVPEDVQKAKAIEFFLFLTGGKNKQKIKEIVINPTAVIPTSKTSKKHLCSDLHIVREQFSRLGMSKSAQSVISEIECLIEELEEKTN
jgi:hypothetical protein